MNSARMQEKAIAKDADRLRHSPAERTNAGAHPHGSPDGFEVESRFSNAQKETVSEVRSADKGLKTYLKTKLKRNQALYRSALGYWRHLKRLRMSIEIIPQYFYDWRRYVRWSHGGADKERGQLERALLKSFHGIEKGLSLSDPRPGFGQKNVRLLMENIDLWIERFGYEGAGVSALSALREYQDFNKQNDIVLPFLDRWLAEKKDLEKVGGTLQVLRREIHEDIAKGQEHFFLSRHSIRNFSGDPVPMEDIRRAVGMARKTPSVCNRQGPRVYCFENAMEALQWQPGNRGFGHLASRGLVVTSDLQAFTGPGERNQCWIDGGMFAMSVIYALHSLGYGTCSLAWAPHARTDRKMRNALQIPENEAVIMMISVGSLPESLRVAVSNRFSIEDILVER